MTNNNTPHLGLSEASSQSSSLTSASASGVSRYLGLMVNVLPQPMLTRKSQVCMNPEDVQKLGGDLKLRNYVQIANRVYQVLCKDWVQSGTIGMQPTHWDDAFCARAHFKNEGSDCVSASLYHKGSIKKNRLLVMNLTVKINWSESSRIKPLIIDAENLQKLVNPFFRHHFFGYEQEVVVPFESGTYTFRVTGMFDGKRDFLKKPIASGNYYFGYVASQTALTIRALDESDLFIMKGKICDPEVTLIFKVTSEDFFTPFREDGYPTLVDITELINTFLVKYSNKKMMLNETFKVSFNSGDSFSLMLSAVTHLKPIENPNHHWYVLQPNQKIGLSNISNDLIFVEGNPAEAQKAKIILHSVEKLNENGVFSSEGIEFLDLNVFKELLKSFKRPFVKMQAHVIKDDGIQVRFYFESASSELVDVESELPIRKHWILTEDTELSFDLAPQAKFVLMEDSKPRANIPQPQKLFLNPRDFLEDFGIGGISDEFIGYIQNIVLAKTKYRQDLREANIQNPKGIMLSGPPGTGKTTIARQIGKIIGISESNTFILESGSKIFKKFTGESETALRNFFKPAIDAWKKYEKNSPSFLFIIDEIDALASIRDEGNDARSSVVNELISTIDGVIQMDNLFIVGITNRIDRIDSAVVRPRRLFPIINIGIPDKPGRLAILRIHTKQIRDQLHSDVNLNKLADLTAKMSGAQITGIIDQVYLDWKKRHSITFENQKVDDDLKIRMKDFLAVLEKMRGEAPSLTMYS